MTTPTDEQLAEWCRQMATGNSMLTSQRMAIARALLDRLELKANADREEELMRRLRDEDEAKARYFKENP